MESKDRLNIQQITLSKYPGTDPEIDIDWGIVEISFKAGQKEVVEFIGNPFEHNEQYEAGTSNLIHNVDDCFACNYEAKLKELGL